MRLTQKQIYAKVCAVLIEALNVDAEEIRLTATLQGDLGAESIDFLDIVFRLERDFGLKIPSYELFPAGIFMGDPAYVDASAGLLTKKGVEKIKTTMPFADLSAFEKKPELTAISDLFTVGLMVRYIQHKLAQSLPRRRSRKR